MQLFIRLSRLEHSVLLNTPSLPSDGGLQQGRGARVGDLGCPIGRQLPILILFCASTIMVLGHQTHSSLSFIEWPFSHLAVLQLPHFAKTCTFISNLFTCTVVHIIALQVQHPSFNWMDAGGEERAHLVLERMGGPYPWREHSRSIVFSNLASTPWEHIEADPGGLRIWINEKSGLTSIYDDHTRLLWSEIQSHPLCRDSLKNQKSQMQHSLRPWTVEKVREDSEACPKGNFKNAYLT